MTEAGKFTVIASRKEFDAAVRSAIAQAGSVGAREMFFVDPDFADWPLNDRSVIESLTGWLGSHRQLTVFAKDFDALARRQLRFVEWRRPWSHVVSFRSDDEVEAEQVPTLLLVDRHVCVRLVDRVHCRGSVSTLGADLVQGREAIDALLQRSAEAYPVTRLGL